jgi:phosphate-selective porin OprO/OprP
MKGKSALLAGVAAIALVASADAGYAAKKASDATSAPAPAPVAAAPAGPTTSELAARIQALEDALQADEAKSESDHTRLSTLEQNFQYASWTFDNGRPTITSGDKRFSMILRVRWQNDLAMFMQDSPSSLPSGAKKDLASGMVTRRAHLGVQGYAFKDFWYEYRYNLGGTDVEAAGLSLARVSYVGIPGVRLNVGVIEPAFMMEGTMSSSQLPFMERPEIDNIAADAFGAGDARRGIEFVYQKAGFLKPDDNLVFMAAYTGGTTAANTGHTLGTDESTQALSRLSYRLWNEGASNLVLGSSFAYAFNQRGMSFQDRPQIRVSGERLIGSSVALPTGVNSMEGMMYAFDASANYDNFWVGGEWAKFTAVVPGAATYNPSFSGWYVEGSWILTGETKGYTVTALNNEIGGWSGPKVANPFSFDGDSWGAWELVARYSDTNLNDTAGATKYTGGEEKIFNTGINWYLNNQIRLGTYYQYVDVDRLNAGQKFSVIGMRLQFTN